MIGNNSEQENDFISEINVTPLVDVVLVLLIIFMISAPLLMNDISLQLPKTKKVQSLNQDAKNIVISINSKGQVFIEKNQVTLNNFEAKLTKYSSNKSSPIYVRVDEQTDYLHVARVLAILKSLSFNKISLVTEIEKK
jgi:biopolymer transport protein ExbD